MTASIDITPAQRKALLDYLARYIPGVEVWAYGSRVKWTARPNSDLDLVAFAEPAQLCRVVELKDALAESDLPFMVDLHVWAEVPERFHEIIRKDYVVLQPKAELGPNAGVAGEWRRVTIAEVCELIVDCVNKTAPVVEEHTPFKMLRTTNIKGGRIDREECRRVSKDTFAKWTRRADVRQGDVILTREAPLGEVGYVDFTDTVFLGQRLMQYRANPALLEPRFLLYSFLSKDLQNQFGAHEGSGSTVSHIRVGDCSKFKLSLPPLAEQKAIAGILGALDDRIELNRRMNETLEALARALFQSWFVDFDPVKAKAEGRKPYGMDEATAALFPAGFQDSELGPIPKGWKAGTVVEGFNLTMGQSPPGDTYNENGKGLPFYQGRTDFGFRFPTRRIFCSAPTRYAKLGDTLVSVRAPVGDINMANEPCCIGRGVAAVRHKSGATSFTYHSMANLARDFDQFEAEGTVFGSINKDSFEKLRFVIPPPQIIAAYERQAGPLDEQIRNFENQSRTLADLRDTLLPKLLSGELSVPAALLARPSANDLLN